MKADENPNKTIAVIGAGIVGLSTAIRLLQQGFAVRLIDPQTPEKAASYGNGGALNPSSVIPITVPSLIFKAPGMLLNPNSPLFIRWRYLPKLIPWLLRYLSHCRTSETNRIADALSPLTSNSYQEHIDLAKGTKAEEFIKPNDYIILYNDRAAFENDAFIWEIRKRLGIKWDVLEGEAYDNFEPTLAGRGFVAVRLPGHGHIADPGLYIQSLTEYFQSLGGELIKASALDFIIENKEIKAVETTAGLYKCASLVLTSGVWSGTLATKLGLNIPLESEGGYHIELIEPSFTPKVPTLFVEGKFIANPMNGRLRCAGIVEFGGLSAPENEAATDLLLKYMKGLFPTLRWKGIRKWMGHRPSTPDSLPVIGKASHLKNTFVAFGHQHVGMSSGPRTGRIIADIIAGKNPDIDLSPYRPDRF